MKKVLAFFQLIRVDNLAIIALSVSLFYFLILVPAHQYKLFTTLLPFTTLEFCLFVLSVSLVAAAGNVINDYFDFELDKEYKPNRPLPQSEFSLDTAMYMHAAFAVTGIAIGFYLGYQTNNYQTGYFYVICVLLLYLYSSYLKKVPLAGNIVVSALTAFVFLLLLMFEKNFLATVQFEGAQYVFGMLMLQVKFYGGFAFITNLARELVKDIEDAEGDASHNIHTMAVQFGINATRYIAVAVLVGLLSGLGFFMKWLMEAGALKQVSYLAVAVCIPVVAAVVLLLTAKEQKDYSRVSLLLKVVMLLGVLSMAAFYLFTYMAA